MCFRLAAATTLLVFASVLSGCGEPKSVEVDRGGRVEITLKNYRFTPQNIDTKQGRLTFALVNRGKVGHNFVLQNSREKKFVKVPTLKPGERNEISVYLPRGSYRMLSTGPGQEVLGMYGSLTAR